MKNIVKFIIWITLFWIGLYMLLQFEGTMNFKYWIGLITFSFWLNWTWGLLNE